MASVRLYNAEKIYKEIARYGKRAFPVIRRSLATTAAEFVTKVRDERMSGPTSSTTVSARSGAMRRGLRFAGVQEEPRGFVAKVTTDRKYTFVHFGPRGQVTTIRPKNAKALAIPLAAAMTASGVAKGSPRNGPWGKTVIIPTKRAGGSLAILYGVRERQSGKNAGKGYGGLVPLFALMKSVQVPARIDPKDFVSWLGKTYIDNMRRGLKELKEKQNA